MCAYPMGAAPDPKGGGPTVPEWLYGSMGFVGTPTLNAGDETRSGKQQGRKLFNVFFAYLKSPEKSENFEYKHMW